jgi:hypothetical protein
MENYRWDGWSLTPKRLNLATHRCNDNADDRRSRAFCCGKSSCTVKDKKIFPAELPGYRTVLVQQPVQIVARFAITI